MNDADDFDKLKSLTDNNVEYREANDEFALCLSELKKIEEEWDNNGVNSPERMKYFDKMVKPLVLELVTRLSQLKNKHSSLRIPEGYFPLKDGSDFGKAFNERKK